MENNQIHNISHLISKVTDSYNGMMDIINNINSVMNKTKMLSINSSIEASRVGTDGKGFAAIANDISECSDVTQNATSEGRKYMETLNECIGNLLGVKVADTAYYTIERIDRTLCECKSDIVSWAELECIKKYLKDKTTDNKIVGRFFEKTVEIKNIYKNIIITDIEGTILYAVENSDNVIRQKFIDKKWYKKVLRKQECYISEPCLDTLIDEQIIVYCMPIKSEDNQIIGTVISIIDWNQIIEDLKLVKVSELGELYLINNNGDVIASNIEEKIEKNLTESMSVARKVVDGEEYGYEIEVSNGEIKAIIGYARSVGHLYYEGKGWSVIIREIINNVS
ncbi:MAG: hypothetical protein E7262_09460 [Lachnospiraceae bacterium]|nr:hypothetical protein [Lachnospiraceae bacterium]